MWDRNYRSNVIHNIPRRIIVFHLSGMGDALMLLPTMRALKGQWPDTEIDVVVRDSATASMIKRGGHVGRTVIYRRPSNAFVRFTFRAKLMLWLMARRYDLAISTSEGGENISVMLWALVRGPRIGFLPAGKKSSRRLTHGVRLDPSKHGIDMYFELARASGCEGEPQPVVLEVEGELGEWVAEEIGRIGADFVVGVHPGSTSNHPWKRWPVERFADALNLVSDSRHVFIPIFGGPSDGDLGHFLSGLITAPAKNYSGSTTLDETIALISRCNVMVTNDNGLMHIAYSLGVPVVGVFGPTNQYRNRPLSIGSVQVTASARCSPTDAPMCAECYSAWRKFGELPECLRKIEPLQVATAIIDALPRQAHNGSSKA